MSDEAQRTSAQQSEYYAIWKAISANDTSYGLTFADGEWEARDMEGDSYHPGGTTLNTQESNLCPLCGGVKDLFPEIRPMATEGVQPASHPVRFFALCPGHPLEKREQAQDNKESA